MRSLLKTFLPACCLLFVVSCAGRKFDSAWQQANKDYLSGKTPAATGPWEGTWISAANGHKGKLRCIITPVAGKEEADLHLFRYWATWGGFFRGGFDSKFEIEKKGSQYHFQGRHNLGIMGSFRHKGVIKDNDFDARYSSSIGDHGSFNLRRPVQ